MRMEDGPEAGRCARSRGTSRNQGLMVEGLGGVKLTVRGLDFGYFGLWGLGWGFGDRRW